MPSPAAPSRAASVDTHLVSALACESLAQSEEILRNQTDRLCDSVRNHRPKNLRLERWISGTPRRNGFARRPRAPVHCRCDLDGATGGHGITMRPRRAPDEISVCAPRKWRKTTLIKSISCVVPQEGFEPPTPSLRMMAGIERSANSLYRASATHLWLIERAVSLLPSSRMRTSIDPA
jgi:hypothetical protein